MPEGTPTRRRFLRVVAAAAGVPLVIAAVRATAPKAQSHTWQLDVLGAAPPAKARPQRRRRSVMLWTLALCVAVPTILATVYFGLIASDQYVVEVRFAVKSTSQSQSRAMSTSLS